MRPNLQEQFFTLARLRDNLSAADACGTRRDHPINCDPSWALPFNSSSSLVMVSVRRSITSEAAGKLIWQSVVKPTLSTALFGEHAAQAEGCVSLSSLVPAIEGVSRLC
jgi:hypothetical protein